MSRARRSRTSRAAALLLEVVVALAVLTTAMGLLSSQLVAGLEMTTFAEEQLRASQLADRILYLLELDPELRQELGESEELEDEFGDEYPGFFWRVTVEPVEPDSEDLFVCTIEVLYQRDVEDQESIEGAEVMRHLALLKATPALIDLVEDGGLSEEMTEQLRQMIPLPEFDPRAVDLHYLVAMDPGALLQLLPMMTSLLADAGQLAGGLSELQQMGEGIDLDNMDDLPEDARRQLELLLEMADQAGTGGGFPQARGGGGNPRPRGRSGQGSGRPGGGGGRGGGGRFEPGGGSGSSGDYTLDDLMRMRDEYEREDKGRGTR